MPEEPLSDPSEQDLSALHAGSDDPGTELVAEIDSRLQEEFPDLERRPDVIHTIEMAVRERSFMFAGPNPPPQMIAEYDRVCPGWGIRLLEQGEREQLARIEREREELAQTRLMIEAETTDKRSQRDIEKRGQVFGFIAFLIIAGIGAWALAVGQTAVAITCFTTFVLGVVALFVTGRKPQDAHKE